MSDIDRKIQEHCKNSRRLKEIYMGNDKISYEKSVEIQRQQNDEYKKMMFLRNLRKEMRKK